jgi:hypothetical protein
MKRRISRWLFSDVSFRSFRRAPWIFASLAIAFVAGGCADSDPATGAGSAQLAAKSASQPALPPPIIVEAAPEAPADAAPEPPPPAALEPPPQAASEPAAQPPPPARSGSIIGKTTSEVRDAEKEKAAGAKVKQPRITGKDPITVSGSAYAAIIGRIEQLQIQDAINKFHAINERYPKDLDEFMKEIIRGYGIRLPQLPYYQKYGYDSQNHALVILEYPHE